MRIHRLFVQALSFIVVAFFALVAGNILYASPNDNITREETKINLKDEFEDNFVLVTLTKEVTWQFEEYSIEDFKEVNPINVEDLTSFTAEYLKKKMKGEKLEEAKINEENYRRILCIELAEKSKENVLHAIEILEKRDDIESADPSFIRSISSVTAGDQYRNLQWSIDNAKIDLAWDITTDSSDVIIGVLDTGIESSHDDLKYNIHQATPHNANTTWHRDFENSSGTKVESPVDEGGHGTHVAGIIGAEGNNGKGIAGVMWNVKLVSLKVFDEDGNGMDRWLINGIEYASTQPIDILNFSGGGVSGSSTLRNKIAAYNGLFIAAAGNSDSDNDTIPMYPANYSTILPNVISVGAINESNQRPNVSHWRYDRYGNPQGSNYGANTVDIFAPGDEILSTIPQNNYTRMSGTSMAAPFVTGVAGLMLSVNPHLTPQQLKQHIINGADSITINVGSSNTPMQVKKLNAFNALVESYSVSTPREYGAVSLALSADNFKEMQMKFDYLGNRVFQTLSSGDTILEIFTRYGTTPIYTDDNSGINNNSRITFIPEVDVIYRIRVSVKSGTSIPVKLIVTTGGLPQSYSLSNQGISNLNGSTSGNKVGLYHITSQVSGDFGFQTNNFYKDTTFIVFDSSGTELGNADELNINLSSNQQLLLIVIPKYPHQSYSMKITKISDTSVGNITTNGAYNASWMRNDNGEAFVSGEFDTSSMYHNYYSALYGNGLAIPLPFSFVGITILGTDDWATICSHETYNGYHYLFIVNPFESFIYLEVLLTGVTDSSGTPSVVDTGIIDDTGYLEDGEWIRYSNNTALISGYFSSDYHNYYSSQYGLVFAIELPFSFTHLEVMTYEGYGLMFYKEGNYLIFAFSDYFYLEIKLSGIS